MKTAIYVVLFCTLLSCDCYRKASAVVADARTHKAIPGAEVRVRNRPGHNSVTDSTGFFEVSLISGGFKCSQIELEIRHPDYENAIPDPEALPDTIFLEAIAAQ